MKSKKRLSILETLQEMPFTCLNCEEKVLKIRDLARLGCHCLRPFYHFHCLPSLPVNLCIKCNKRAHTLRGVRAIWDSFTHDEWKSSLDLDLLKGENRQYVIELMDSMFLDWEDNDSDVGIPSNCLNFLICDYWKVFDLLELEKSENIHDLILNRLNDAEHLYPQEDRVILASKSGIINKIRKDGFLINHTDFLKKLWIYSQGVINTDLLNWIKEDMIRNQSIFFTGPLLFHIIYREREREREREGKGKGKGKGEGEG
ncbi:MAG: hypothetical protein WD512_08385, partial [Candidatus Paceibacterota bacterium]